MKYSPAPRIAFVAAISAAAISSIATSFAQTESRRTIVITAPAVKDGSNSSRAPFVASRQFDDVNSPNAQPIDLNSPPNTVATNLEAYAIPTARVAVMQSNRPAIGTADPGTLPTGRTTTTVSSTADTSTTYVATTPATTTADSRRTIVITAPAVKDGSNSSRAPFVASRQFDDVNSPNAQPIDLNSPPNTVATNLEAYAIPTARVAVMQSNRPAIVTADPGTLPTGRTTVTTTAEPSVTTTTTTTTGAPAKTTVISAPAVKDGSNAARAPYIAERQFDDVKSPDGQAIDQNVPPAPKAP